MRSLGLFRWWEGGNKFDFRNIIKRWKKLQENVLDSGRLNVGEPNIVADNRELDT